MISRRGFLLSTSALVPIVLSGCATLEKGINDLYVNLHVVAQKIEQAVAIAKSSLVEAAKILEPFFVAVCQVVVSLVDVGRELIAAGILKAEDPAIIKAMNLATGLATDSIILAAANLGTIPTNPLVILSGIIQIVALIMTYTGHLVTPTAAK